MVSPERRNECWRRRRRRRPSRVHGGNGLALTGPLEPLGEIRQRGGKRVLAFAVEGDIDVQTLKSNTFEIEWPPKGGKMQTFPEIDRAEWFDLPAAHAKILESQRPLLDRLAELVGQPGARQAP
jgi:predicted NUDIX family NTP pyrophosphohydrolase